MKNIAIIAGGDSSEYEVSLKSAKNICDALSGVNRYRIFPIICRGRNWVYEMKDGNQVNVDKNDFSLAIGSEKVFLDYAYITIHGIPGENGEIQGYFDILGIPYSTGGVLNTSIGFNKFLSKTIVQIYGINTPKGVCIKKGDNIDESIIVSELGLPLFVKPNEGGSSFGITKAKEGNSLRFAIDKAFRECDNVIIEEAIKGREFTCGLYKSKGKINVLPITEIITDQEFFDYDAKYLGNSKEVTPANIPEDLKILIEETSIKAYEELNCRGIVRIDYIYDGKKLYFLEVNLTPGMTQASLVPQQIRACGLTLTEVIIDIIEK